MIVSAVDGNKQTDRQTDIMDGTKEHIMATLIDRLFMVSN